MISHAGSKSTPSSSKGGSKLSSNLTSVALGKSSGKVTFESAHQKLYDAVCETYALAAQTLGAHWNYVGRDFASMHVLFENQYKEMLLALDVMAERLRALGLSAPFDTMQMSARVVKLGRFELMAATATDEDWINTLIANHTQFSTSLDAAIEGYDQIRDLVSHDLMVARKAFHDKVIWMLKASTYSERRSSTERRRNMQ